VVALNANQEASSVNTGKASAKVKHHSAPRGNILSKANIRFILGRRQSLQFGDVFRD
jgi:hypothetical protein